MTSHSNIKNKNKDIINSNNNNYYNKSLTKFSGPGPIRTRGRKRIQKPIISGSTATLSISNSNFDSLPNSIETFSSRYKVSSLRPKPYERPKSFSNNNSNNNNNTSENSLFKTLSSSITNSISNILKTASSPFRKNKNNTNDSLENSPVSNFSSPTKNNKKNLSPKSLLPLYNSSLSRSDYPHFVGETPYLNHTNKLLNFIPPSDNENIDNSLNQISSKNPLPSARNQFNCNDNNNNDNNSYTILFKDKNDFTNSFNNKFIPKSNKQSLSNTDNTLNSTQIFDFTGIKWDPNDPISVVNAYREALKQQELQKQSNLISVKNNSNPSQKLISSSKNSLTQTKNLAKKASSTTSLLANDKIPIRKSARIAKKNKAKIDSSNDNLLQSSTDSSIITSNIQSEPAPQRLIKPRRRVKGKSNPNPSSSSLANNQKIDSLTVIEKKTPILSNDISLSSLNSSSTSSLTTNNKSLTNSSIIQLNRKRKRPVDLHSIAPERKARPGFFSANFDEEEDETLPDDKAFEKHKDSEPNNEIQKDDLLSRNEKRQKPNNFSFSSTSSIPPNTPNCLAKNPSFVKQSNQSTPSSSSLFSRPKQIDPEILKRRKEEEDKFKNEALKPSKGFQFSSSNLLVGSTSATTDSTSKTEEQLSLTQDNSNKEENKANTNFKSKFSDNDSSPFSQDAASKGSFNSAAIKENYSQKKGDDSQNTETSLNPSSTETNKEKTPFVFSSIKSASSPFNFGAQQNDLTKEENHKTSSSLFNNESSSKSTFEFSSPAKLNDASKEDSENVKKIDSKPTFSFSASSNSDEKTNEETKTSLFGNFNKKPLFGSNKDNGTDTSSNSSPSSKPNSLFNFNSTNAASKKDDNPTKPLFQFSTKDSENSNLSADLPKQENTKSSFNFNFASNSKPLFGDKSATDSTENSKSLNEVNSSKSKNPDSSSSQPFSTFGSNSNAKFAFGGSFGSSKTSNDNKEDAKPESLASPFSTSITSNSFLANDNKSDSSMPKSEFSFGSSANQSSKPNSNFSFINKSETDNENKNKSTLNPSTSFSFSSKPAQSTSLFNFNSSAEKDKPLFGGFSASKDSNVFNSSSSSGTSGLSFGNNDKNNTSSSAPSTSLFNFNSNTTATQGPSSTNTSNPTPTIPTIPNFSFGASSAKSDPASIFGFNSNNSSSIASPAKSTIASPFSNSTPTFSPTPTQQASVSTISNSVGGINNSGSNFNFTPQVNPSSFSFGSNSINTNNSTFNTSFQFNSGSQNSPISFGTTTQPQANQNPVAPVSTNLFTSGTVDQSAIAGRKLATPRSRRKR